MNSKYVEVLKCRIDVVDKGKRRLMNVQVRYKQPVSDFYNHIRIYHKSGNGKFLPSVINLDLDACKAAEIYDSKNPIIGRFGSFFERFVPELREGCPFKGVFNISDFDMTKEAPDYFPPALTEGVYKMHSRIHFGSNNRTIVETDYVFEVKMKKGAGLGGLLSRT